MLIDEKYNYICMRYRDVVGFGLLLVLGPHPLHNGNSAAGHNGKHFDCPLSTRTSLLNRYMQVLCLPRSGSLRPFGKLPASGVRIGCFITETSLQISWLIICGDVCLGLFSSTVGRFSAHALAILLGP
jgi:hypothetical protein